MAPVVGFRIRPAVVENAPALAPVAKAGVAVPLAHSVALP